MQLQKFTSELGSDPSCRDVETSRAFYTDVLGFSVLYGRPDHGFYYLVRDSVEIMIEQVSEATWKSADMDYPYGRGLHFQIMIEDVEELYHNCRLADVPIFREMEEAWYRADDQFVGQRQFVLLDPDGFMLRFAEDLGRRATPPASGRSVS